MSEYAKGWEDHVRKNARRFRYGTEAHHQLGDISRDVEDIFYYRAKDDANYYGEWLTGFGFIRVRFPAETTRALTDDEIEWLATHPVVFA